jgi:hypothetical protein
MPRMKLEMILAIHILDRLGLSPSFEPLFNVNQGLG